MLNAQIQCSMNIGHQVWFRTSHYNSGKDLLVVGTVVSSYWYSLDIHNICHITMEIVIGVKS